MAGLGIVLWGLSSRSRDRSLPGDIYVRRGNFSFYFPLMTSIILSIVLTILFSLLRR